MENNKFILVSAATSDIGTAITQNLSAKYNLLIHGRSSERLEEVARNLNSPNHVKIWVYDLKDTENIQSSLKAVLIEQRIEVFGFVHCAGTLRILPIKNFRLDYAKEIFDVNFFSAVEIIKTLLLRNNNKALSNIVFISALYSKFGNKANSVYAASKGAIDSLVKSLAVELAPNVRVNSVLPGGIETKMTADFFKSEENMEMFNQSYPLGVGSCDDIANMVEFLISSKSKWITGQNYFVDGGRSCN